MSMVFGRDPKLPAGLMSDPDGVEAHQERTNSHNLQDIEQIRCAAMCRFHDFENSESLRSAMLRKGRPWRGPFEVGQRIAYWRDSEARASQSANRRTQPAGYQIGTICSIEPGPSGNVWVRSERTGRQVAVARKQLRSAVGSELWSPSSADLKALQDARKDLEDPEATFENLRGLGPSDNQDVPLDPSLLPPIFPFAIADMPEQQTLQQPLRILPGDAPVTSGNLLDDRPSADLPAIEEKLPETPGESSNSRQPQPLTADAPPLAVADADVSVPADADDVPVPATPPVALSPFDLSEIDVVPSRTEAATPAAREGIQISTSPAASSSSMVPPVSKRGRVSDVMLSCSGTSHNHISDLVLPFDVLQLTAMSTKPGWHDWGKLAVLISDVSVVDRDLTSCAPKCLRRTFNRTTKNWSNRKFRLLT